MKVGVNLLNFGPGANPTHLLAWAKVIESLGYHSLMICDHVAITPELSQRYPEPFYDPFTTLAWLAGQTERVSLGTTVIVLPYRNPVLMARLGANIDQISGGRFIFGVGVGGNEREFQTLGVPFHQRGAISTEYLDVILTLWTGTKVSYKGRFVSFTDISSPKPLQTPHPPIWVGGSSDAAIKRAVAVGDGWHPIRINKEWLANTGIPKLKQYANDMEKSTPALCPRIRLEITAKALPEESRLMGQGTLTQIRRDLESLERMGAQHVLFDWFTGDVEATRNHETGWRMLAVLAEQALDLGHETLR